MCVCALHHEVRECNKAAATSHNEVRMNISLHLGFRNNLKVLGGVSTGGRWFEDTIYLFLNLAS